MTKRGYIILIALIVLFSFFASAQEMQSLAEGTEIFGVAGVKYKPLAEGGARISFDKGGMAEIDGNPFEHIQPSSKTGLPSFIEVELDESGNVIVKKADFMTDASGGTYVFGGTKVYAPPNSYIKFDGNEIKIQAPPESKFDSFQIPSSTYSGKLEYRIIIEGENLMINGHILNSGGLVYSGGQAIIPSAEKITIDDITIDNSFLPEVNIYFDEKSHGGRSISFGESSLIVSSEGQKSPVINFGENNPYLTVYNKKNTYIAMQALENSKITITDLRRKGLYPKMETEGDFIIDEDSKSVYSDKNNIMISNKPRFAIGSAKLSTSPIEIVPYKKPSIFVSKIGEIVGGEGNERVKYIKTGLTESSPRIGSSRSITVKGTLFHDEHEDAGFAHQLGITQYDRGDLISHYWVPKIAAIVLPDNLVEWALYRWEKLEYQDLGFPGADATDVQAGLRGINGEQNLPLNIPPDMYSTLEDYYRDYPNLQEQGIVPSAD